MSNMLSSRLALPGWAIVLVLVTLSPLPLTVPSGIGLAVIGLLGTALLFRQSSQPMPALVAVPAPRASRDR